MAIAFDAKATLAESFFADNTSTSLTVGALTNGVLLIVVACDGGGVLATPTVGGSTTGVTRIATKQAAGAGTVQVDWYRKVAPASGSTTVAVTCSGASFVSIWAASYSGVDQTAPFGTPGTAGGDSVGPATVNVTTTAGDLVLDALCFDPGGGARTVTVGAGQSTTNGENTSGNGSGLASSVETASGGTTTMSWTLSTSTQWATAAAVMNPAAASGGQATRSMHQFRLRRD